MQERSVLAWQWSRFGNLGVDGIYDMLALRCRVFVLEQGPFQDPDGLDRYAWHLLGRDAGGELRAYLRVVEPGPARLEPSLGRVALDKALRGRGLGHCLVAQGLQYCDQVWPGRANHISAQAHLQRFYGRHGYQAFGASYLEDGIAHIGMHRCARLGEVCSTCVQSG